MQIFNGGFHSVSDHTVLRPMNHAKNHGISTQAYESHNAIQITTRSLLTSRWLVASGQLHSKREKLHLVKCKLLISRRHGRRPKRSFVSRTAQWPSNEFPCSHCMNSETRTLICLMAILKSLTEEHLNFRF